MNLIQDITIGADPEVFIKHNKTGEFIPSFLIVSGDKDNPTDMGGGYQILSDNVTLEGNIPPASDKAGYIKHMSRLIDIFNTTIKANNSNLELLYADSAEFAPDKLEFAEAKLFGCAPFNTAYAKQEHVAPDISKEMKRVAGNHQHFGYKSIYEYKLLNPHLVKAFDMFLTAPSRFKSNDSFRSKYYGVFGAYRNKDYGVEFRSLGGYTFAPEYYNRIYDSLMTMTDYVNSFPDVIEFSKAMDLVTERVLSNKTKYIRLCNQLGINYSQLTF